MSEMAQERTANVVLTADVDPYRQSIQAAGQDTSRLTGQIDKLTKSLDNLSKSAGKKMTFFGAGTTAAIVASTAAFASFDKQMTALKVNAEVTGRSYEKMTRNVNDLRKEFGVATSSAVALNKTILGFKDNSAPINKMSETFVRLGAAVGEAPEAMAQGMLQLQRSMGTSQRHTERYANVLTDLSVRSGVAASSILEFSQVIAPIGRVAGMTQTEIMGVSTAFNKAGQDGYMAANAFNKMLSDIMQSVQSGSPDLAKYANLIGVTVGQFKEMNKTEAITQIFDELNRMGPNAIQILNRMGLDGMRMQRAIAGVSQQTGGIGAAVSQAVAAYGDGSASSLNKGSAVALDGVSDRMGRLGESTKMFAESIGSAFAGPAKQFIAILQQIVDVSNAIAQSPLAKLAGTIAGIVGAVAMGVGPLLTFAGTLGSLAMARQFTKNWVTSGVRDSFNERTGGAAPMSPAGIRYGVPGETHMGQRAGYRLGQMIGGLTPQPLVLAPGSPGYLSRGAGAAMRGAAFGLNVLGGTYTGLRHPDDPGARVRLFSTPNERAAGNGWGPGRMFSSSTLGGTQVPSTEMGTMGRAIIGGGRIAMLPVDWASRLAANVPGSNNRPPIFGGAGANAGVLARAGLNFTGQVVGAGAGLAGIGLRAGWRGISSLAGGPMGMAMMGATGIAALSSYTKQNNQLDLEGGLTLVDAHNAALGRATTSAENFAAALDKAAGKVTPRTKGEAMEVTRKDLMAAQSPDFKYTDERYGTLTRSQITGLLSSQMSGADAEVTQSIKMDLLKRFGDESTVESILATANRGQFNTRSFVKDLASFSGGGISDGFGFGANDGTNMSFEALATQLSTSVVNATEKGGVKAGRQQNLANLNQVLLAFGEQNRQGNLSDAELNQFDKFFNKMFLAGNGDVGGEVWKDIQTDKLLGGSKGGTQEGLARGWTELINAGGKSKAAVDVLLTRSGLKRGVGQGGFLTTESPDLEQFGGRLTPEERYRSTLARTDAGFLFQNNPVIQKALQPGSTADQNAQIQAADEMVRVLRKAGGGFSEVDRKLIRFQAAIQDTTDPLYQLASAARGINAQNLQFKLPYMSSADQFGAQTAGFTAVMSATRPEEGRALSPDAVQQRKDAKSQMEQVKLAQRNQLMALVQQQREFNIAKERGEEDFYSIQLPRMEEQYNLSRARAWEDYNISRTRSETEFNIQRARSQQQFALSMKDSYFDYHLSRKRAEQDFAHQQVLLARQAAQGMYDVYQRTMVQRTWAGPSLLQNSEDQLRRMREQNNNLDKARQMGLSKNAIQQLGFTDAANAQQLDRFIEDAMRNPALINKFNQNANRRLKQGKQLATDPANPQWEEMRRQFSLTMNRGEEDFERAMSRNRRNYRISMKQSQEDFGRAMDNNALDMKRAMARSAQDYATSLSHMKEDFTRQQDRAAKDLKRSQRELTWSFEETLEKAVKKLSGSAQEQAQLVMEFYNNLKAFLKSNEIEIYVAWKSMPGHTRFSDPLDRHGLGEGGNRRASASGGLFMGSQPLTVGEAGPELLLPLNNQGAHFAAALLNRFSSEAKMTQVSGRGMPISGGSVNNYRIDKSTNFTGPVQVSGVENPRQLAEKARQEARRKQLVRGVRHK